MGRRQRIAYENDAGSRPFIARYSEFPPPRFRLACRETLTMSTSLRVACLLLTVWGVAAAIPAVGAEPAKGPVKLTGGKNTKFPPIMAGSSQEVFKKVGDTELSLYIYQPDDHKPTDRRPAIVFFFGGGWTAGSAAQFEYQCRYLAARGMVAVAADYRVRSRNQSKVIDSVSDAKSAVRYLRTHAARLGIDADRIAAGGGSAGGHLAACTALLKEFDEPTEDATISSAPNALVLFNPAVALAPKPGQEVTAAMTKEWMDRAGVEPQKVSPAAHVRKGLPPTLILIGTADSMFASNQEFVKQMVEAGNRAELEAYEKMPHGFFNISKQKDSAMFRATLERTDRFLASLGYLSGEPTVATYFE
ncbi:MAG: alpha/beta hydrolase [Pirellula sp.]|nr:alpha/beta hydrolase [Pirellula sp.]